MRVASYVVAHFGALWIQYRNLTHMNVIVCKKGSIQNIGMRYKSWVEKYVNKGLAHEYDIIQYPEIVILKIINEDGYTVRKKIVEYKEAKKLTDKSPKEYGFVQINIPKLKEDHLEISRLISRKDSFSLFNPLRISASLRLLSFSLCHFERKYIESKPWAAMRNKRTQNAITILLSLLAIVASLYIAHRQGIKLF